MRSSRKKKRNDGGGLELAWFLYFGRKLGMSKREILTTRYGEMIDMLNCMAIERGAKPKKKMRKWSFDEAISLR